MQRDPSIEAVFGVSRALVGMIHAGALPGTPQASQPVARLAEEAVAEAQTLHAAGFHGLILENMHDRPYQKGEAAPEVVAAMTAIAREVKRASTLPLGIQILAGANREALAVALAADAAFIRVEGFVFAHVGDEGMHDACAGELLRYRRAIGADHVRVFADVKKKHSAHAITADIDVVATAQAAEFFLADGVIVTGAATGHEADPAEVAAVAGAISIPTLVGSGVRPETIARYERADAFIVGSALKQGGVWSNPLDKQRIEALVRAFERVAVG